MILPYPFVKLTMDTQYLQLHSVKEAEVQESYLRRVGAILNSCSRYHRGTMKNELVEFFNAETGHECLSWFKLNFMDIGYNPYGQVNTNAKYMLL